MKRKGIPAEAINYFCDLISVSRKGNDKQVDIAIFEACVWNFLKKNCPHSFGVIDPIPLILINFKENQVIPK